MEQYIVDMCAQEGHLDYYESRRALWGIFKEEHLEENCRIFRELYSELKDKWRRKADSDINFRIDWYKRVMELGEHFSGGMFVCFHF